MCYPIFSFFLPHLFLFVSDSVQSCGKLKEYKTLYINQLEIYFMSLKTCYELVTSQEPVERDISAALFCCSTLKQYM